MRGWCAALLCLGVAVVAPEQARSQVSTYLDFNGLTSELRSVTNGSDVARMSSLGTSREGRDIWMIEVSDGSGPPTDVRPGVLVVGNLSGDHLLGSHLALEAIRYLTENGAGEAALNEHVIYVIPRLNPDGAETHFSGPSTGRRGNALPYDDDNDGRVDEDGFSDVNGDGVVSVMRALDADGAFMVDPDDARLMLRADRSKGERGTHTLYWEGVDDDGDGFIGEDGQGGVDLDRNFQHEYPYWDADAGANMVSEPESRALMDFVVAHKNIAAIVTFGHSDNLVTPPDSRGALAAGAGVSLFDFATESLAGVFDEGVYATPFQQGGLQLRGAQPGSDNDPNSGRRPEVTVNGQDREYFNRISSAYQEITGIDEVAQNRTARGAFFQYGYYQFGVPSFSTPGWGLPDGGDEADGEGDARLLTAFEGAGIDAFVPWSPFRHPELGDVEVGGFRAAVLTNPPASMVPALGRAHGEFVARVSSLLPRVRIADTSVEAHGGGLFTVTADIVNEGYLPSALQHGVTSRTVDPVMVQIQVAAESIVTGAAKSHRITRMEGSGARESVSWVIRARNGASVEIRLRSEKGGVDSATVTLGGDDR